MNILQWEKGGKLWRKLWVEGLHDEREWRELREHKKWKIFYMLTNEDQASLNIWKRILKQYKVADKVLFAFGQLLWIVNPCMNSKNEQ